MRHVMILGALGVIVATAGAVATWNAEPAFGPKWYPLLLIVTAFAMVWIGGILRMTQKGRSSRHPRPRKRFADAEVYSDESL
jgi:uncharacterized membrane protein YfcA